MRTFCGFKLLGKWERDMQLKDWEMDQFIAEQIMKEPGAPALHG